MRFDPAGWPFIGGALALALMSGAAVGWVLALPFVVLGLFFAFFFRDPNRRAPDPSAGSGQGASTGSAQGDHVLAPADGRVLVAGPAEPGAAPPGVWQQISIFLSPMDVHVNRIPVSGRVTRVTYTPGRFLPAYRPDAASSNERSEICIDHDGQAIVVRQLVGILARRVVTRVPVGADVHAGDRFGIMKFGSRMDVFLPPSAMLLAKVGDRVRGGETVIAVLH